MDTNTRESLWQLWTKTDYVETNYPEVAKAYKKGFTGDFAKFMQKKYPQLIDEFVRESPYMPGFSGCKGSKKTKKGKLGKLTIITERYPESKLINLVAEDAGVSKDQAKAIIDSYWSHIMGLVSAHKIVPITKVGTFQLTKRKYTDNFRHTGTKEVESVKFAMSKFFKDQCLGK